MTVTGIIAEFNPFHNGHKYLLQQAKGLKVIAMSGNFVQRGEPAIVDKWTRAQMALENGADIVVELPFLVSVQSADYFAKGSIDILEKLGVDNLAFGTEEGVDYQELADVYKKNEKEMLVFLENLPNHLTYPQKTQKMWETFANVKFTGDTPNHILGLTYAKAASQTSIRLNPIKRQGSAYHSNEKQTYLASATAIRNHINDKAFVDKSVPNSELLLGSPQVNWKDYFPYLKYQILSHQNLSLVSQVNEEMASRIQKYIKSVETVDELVEKVATKRYTKARVSRLLTYILVNAVDSDLPDAIHILGFTVKGQEHLKSLKSKVKLVSRIGSEPWDLMTQKADLIYRLGNSKINEQNWGRIPIMIKS